jgi:CspA family cold shock protein
MSASQSVPSSQEDTGVTTGTVVWFDPVKGRGYIRPTDGQREVDVELADVRRSGLETLIQGQHVAYQLERRPDGRFVAVNLKLVEPAETPAPDRGTVQGSGAGREGTGG